MRAYLAMLWIAPPVFIVVTGVLTAYVASATVCNRVGPAYIRVIRTNEVTSVYVRTCVVIG
jgi:hypothetical protein